MNKVIKVAMSKGYNVQHMNENYIQEYARVINSKAKIRLTTHGGTSRTFVNWSYCGNNVC